MPRPMPISKRSATPNSWPETGGIRLSSVGGSEDSAGASSCPGPSAFLELLAVELEAEAGAGAGRAAGAGRGAAAGLGAGAGWLADAG